MITITLTEAEAARVCYALEAEAANYSGQLYAERTAGLLSASSGGRELILESSRDECLAIARKIDEAHD